MLHWFRIILWPRNRCWNKATKYSHSAILDWKIVRRGNLDVEPIREWWIASHPDWGWCAQPVTGTLTTKIKKLLKLKNTEIVGLESVNTVETKGKSLLRNLGLRVLQHVRFRRWWRWSKQSKFEWGGAYSRQSIAERIALKVKRNSKVQLKEGAIGRRDWETFGEGRIAS